MQWLALAIILVIAKLFGSVAVRLKQPAVLGELLGGILVGNLYHLPGFAALSPDHLVELPIVEQLAEVGVLLLLFMVGLESTVKQMLAVGFSSLAVATLGICVPFGLGWLVGRWSLPEQSHYVHIFLGAALTATSVGITARVLQDLKQSKSKEARIILGAAVLDDVMGLVVLAVVTAIIASANTGQSVSVLTQSLVLAKAVAFLVIALVVGQRISPHMFHFASNLRTSGVLVAVSLAFCFIMAWLSEVVGLASIVGAFAAGLVLEDVHYKVFKERGDHTVEELIKPIADFTVPIFFVSMGMKTNLLSMARPEILVLAGLITLAAVLGKQVCGLGAVGGPVNRLTVGIGMIPRGEVGLIFANIGMSLQLEGRPLISEAIFSAVVFMVLITTLITPPLLKWSFKTRHAPT